MRKLVFWFRPTAEGVCALKFRGTSEIIGYVVSMREGREGWHWYARINGQLATSAKLWPLKTRDLAKAECECWALSMLKGGKPSDYTYEVKRRIVVLRGMEAKSRNENVVRVIWEQLPNGEFRLRLRTSKEIVGHVKPNGPVTWTWTAEVNGQRGCASKPATCSEWAKEMCNQWVRIALGDEAAIRASQKYEIRKQQTREWKAAKAELIANGGGRKAV